MPPSCLLLPWWSSGAGWPCHPPSRTMAVMASRDPEKDRPVLVGLLALVGVAVAIGLLGGLAVMVGVKATGLDGSVTATDESATPSTFTLPKPTDTGSVPEPV